MRGPLAVVAAGGAFAGTALGGLLLGWWIDARAHTEYWFAVLLLAGLVLGGYAAYRLIAPSLLR